MACNTIWVVRKLLSTNMVVASQPGLRVGRQSKTHQLIVMTKMNTRLSLSYGNTRTKIHFEGVIEE